MSGVLRNMPAVEVYGRLAGALPRNSVSRIYSVPWATRAIRRALDGVMPIGMHEAEVVAGPLAGTRLMIYPRHEVSFISGLWEFWLQDALMQCVGAGDVVWDVGAYIGYFSLLMAQRGASVLALEPDPANRERLEWTLATNGATEVRVLPVAAAERDGVASLQPQGDSPAAAAVMSGTSRGTLVATRSLDSLCEEYGPPRVVKLDVESREASVLDGAHHLLRDAHPVWLMELHGDAGDQAVELLRSAGYQIRLLNRLESATHQRHVLAV